MRGASHILLIALLALGTVLAVGQDVPPAGQQMPSLTERGFVKMNGEPVPYVIRHLPVNSFPALPAGVQQELNQRGCLIPQTYQAHRPENVIHASLEHTGSSDWAVLCSEHGTATLLVFFGSKLDRPMTLASSPETERLQVRGGDGVLGFNWGIDPASPQQVRDAQAGMDDHPPMDDHDALADSAVDQHTVYHYYTHGAWILLDMPD
jgi:hypothetical protein